MRNGFEWLRLFTPIGITITLFILGQMWMQMNAMNEKVYLHQTNADLHIPRSELVELKHDIAEMRREVIQTIRRERNQGGNHG